MGRCYCACRNGQKELFLLVAGFFSRFITDPRAGSCFRNDPAYHVKKVPYHICSLNTVSKYFSIMNIFLKSSNTNHCFPGGEGGYSDTRTGIKAPSTCLRSFWHPFNSGIIAHATGVTYRSLPPPTPTCGPGKERKVYEFAHLEKPPNPPLHQRAAKSQTLI